MGKYDIPAFIDKIIEVTGAPKVTYIGYSLGTNQMFYGLGTMEEIYYQHKLDRFIALSPCLYLSEYLHLLFNYERLVFVFGVLYRWGIYYVLPVNFGLDVQALSIFIYYY